MVKKCLFTWLCILIVSIVNAQIENNSTREEASLCRESIEKNISNNNPDAAIIQIKKLYSLRNGTTEIRNLFHSSIAGYFFGLQSSDGLHEQQNTCYSILKTLSSDTNKHLASITQPLYLATSIVNSKSNNDVLKHLVNEFTGTQLTRVELFEDKIFRYAFIIYKYISQEEALHTASDSLLNASLNVLNREIKKRNIHSIQSEDQQEQAFWLRWMFACGNYFEALRNIKDNPSKAKDHFSRSCDFSVDNATRQYSLFYFRDMIFIFKKEIYFENEYFRYIAQSGSNKKEALNLLSRETLIHYTAKNELRKYYNDNFSKEKTFDVYWLSFLDQHTSIAPRFDLKTINGSKFNLSAQKGKWVLIDFWGTWCAPCRQEHPSLEKFYRKVSQKSPDKFVLITIACKDNKKAVEEYLQKNSYSFPVAMSNDLIEKNYTVAGYPSKFLITPQGRYLQIPLDVDWIDYINKMADLD